MRFGQPGRHRQQCYAERAIQKINEPLIQRMNAQELLTGEPSVKWIEDFRAIVDEVDRQWRRDPPKVPLGLPRISKNDELLTEGTRVREGPEMTSFSKGGGGQSRITLHYFLIYITLYYLK